MRYKADHKEASRAGLLAGIGRGFRRRGYSGIGVDGLAKEAGMTSGAFYAHFSSKDLAFQETITAGLRELRDGILALQAEHGKNWLPAFIDYYLGHKRICELGESCAMQSLTPEVQRAGPEIRETFERGMAEVVSALAAGLVELPSKQRTAHAWMILAQLAGAVTLARAVADPKTGAAIAEAARVTAIRCGQA
jgi:TetR/AcrR family transcriptional regulator, transcriptional repressor for nem operon